MLGMLRLKMCLSEGVGVKLRHKAPIHFMKNKGSVRSNADPARFTFRSVLTRWIPFGTTIYASWFWYKTRHNLDKVSQSEIDFYKTLPLRVTSRLWGRISRLELPLIIRPLVYGTYASMFGVNLSEASIQDLKKYRSLAEFFTRSLKDNARVIDTADSVCPCDGFVLTCGPVTSDMIEQVKGITYSLETFLNSTQSTNQSYYDTLLKKKSNILHQCVIYLAPGDYHRFHSPCEWTTNIRKHFYGKLLSVNPSIAKLIPGLFTINERVVYTGLWKHGFYSYTAVGATNVGSIEVYYDSVLRTNVSEARECNEISLKPNVLLGKGEIMGQFNMGSTIVLIFEAPKEFRFAFNAGAKVQMGQRLGDIGKS